MTWWRNYSRASDLRSRGCGFDSRSRRGFITTAGLQVAHIHVPLSRNGIIWYRRQLGVNRHATRCTSSVSAVSQRKLVSGWGLHGDQRRPGTVQPACVRGSHCLVSGASQWSHIWEAKLYVRSHHRHHAPSLCLYYSRSTRALSCLSQASIPWGYVYRGPALTKFCFMWGSSIANWSNKILTKILIFKNRIFMRNLQSEKLKIHLRPQCGSLQRSPTPR